jgi:hypothetical protein
MKKRIYIICIILSLFILAACGATYKAKPLPFKTPSAYPNAQEVAGAVVAAKAYVNSAEAKEVFGFDVLEAGMLPVQLVFDNQGTSTLEVDTSQTFLEDREGNIWPILAKKFAYERATKYAKTKEIFKEGAYHGFLGAAGGALVGAAVGIVSGEDVAAAAGKGAAAGAAAGGVIGGTKGYAEDDASKTITEDLQQKSLQTKSIQPDTLSYGVIFFPGESKSAKRLRLKVIDVDSGTSKVLFLDF